MTKHSAPDYKTAIIARAREQGLQITTLREQVLDIVLRQEGVIKAYPATTTATAATSSNTTTAPSFWCVPSAATPMSKPSPANGRRCAPA